MGSLNSVTIIGNLGADPELKSTPNGAKVCNFSVATSEKFKDKAGNQVEQTEWHRVTCWEKTAELCAKYLAKGRSVCVQGKLKTRSWEKDGQKHYATDIVAHNVVFLSDGKGGGREESAAPGPAATGGVDDEIPF